MTRLGTTAALLALGGVLALAGCHGKAEDTGPLAERTVVVCASHDVEPAWDGTDPEGRPWRVTSLLVTRALYRDKFLPTLLTHRLHLTNT